MFSRHAFAAVVAVPFLFLAPAGAQAQVNCSLSSGVATCVDQPYSMGIIFEAGTGWNAGVAGNAAVTVNGGSNTMISAPAARTNPGWRNAGIVLRTSNAAMREIALTVGTGANAVVITEHGTVSNTNHGIYVHQAATGAGDTSGTTVTLRSGVRIGTSSAPMRRTGVHALILGNDNAGVHTITSAATIHSTTFGIEMVNRSLGRDVVTNSGSITTAATGGGPGIQVSPGEGSEVDARSGSSTTTNAATGTITTSAANAHGIRVLATGVALYKVVNQGNIAVSGVPAHGILVDGRRFKGGAQGATDTVDGGFEIENSGTITASGAGSFGIYVEATGNVMNTGTDPITITNTGDITSASHAILVGSEQGAVTVRANEGELKSTSGDGIAIQQRADAGMTVTSGADITAGMHGIRVQAVPDLTTPTTPTTGDISITTTGGSIKAEGDGRHGIYPEDHAYHEGTVTISNAADITADQYGIYANRLGAGAVSVTNAGRTVLGKNQAGIYAANQAGDASDVTVGVTGGTVRSMGKSTPAVVAENRGTGGVTVTIAAGATLNSMYNAGVYANLVAAGNTAGTIKVTQGGTIAARKGVYARAGRASAEGETRAAAAQPLIDVTWSGTFSHGTTADVSQDDMGRYVAANHSSLIGIDREVQTERTIRYGSPAGIEAQVMSWRDVAETVATGDDPGALADDAARAMVFDTASSDAALKAKSDAIVAQFKAALQNDDIMVDVTAIDTDGTEGLTDAEISAFLSADNATARGLLQNVMAWGLSEEEKTILRAVATNDGVAAALTAAGFMDDAADDDDYWSRVMALLDRHNVGDIRVNMTGGSIASRGDGIRAYYATYNDGNGAIDVTVAEGATVTGGVAGVYVANAGLDAGEDGTADDILKQTVTVNGMVTGGTDAAVHLVGGGTLTVGETGKVHAGEGSGRPAILVNDPGRSVIVIEGEVRGSEGATAAVDLAGGGSVTVGPMGMVIANGATSAIRGSGGTYQVAVYAGGTALTKLGVNAAIGRVQGGIVAGTDGTVADRAGAEGKVTYAVVETAGDFTTGRYLPLALDAAGNPVTEGDAGYTGLQDCPDAGQMLENGACVPRPPEMPETETPRTPPMPIDCGRMGESCRLYEALPSALLAMNELPTYGDRMAAARDGNGGWARIDGADGEWKAEGTQPNMAFDYRRYGVQAGVDLAMGGDGLFGVSVRGLQGSAEMAGSGGEIELSGVGAGVHGTAFLGGGFHVDAQAMASWYDVKLTADQETMQGETRKRVRKDGAQGRGFAMALEVGRRTEVGDRLAVTPAVGLAWSDASLSFTDVDRHPVSVDDARSLQGRAGLRVESRTGGPRLFGSVEATREFSDERTATVPGTALKTTEAQKTGVRVGIGGAHGWGRYALRAAAGYAARGSGNGQFDGGLSFAMRF